MARRHLCPDLGEFQEKEQLGKVPEADTTHRKQVPATQYCGSGLTMGQGGRAQRSQRPQASSKGPGQEAERFFRLWRGLGLQGQGGHRSPYRVQAALGAEVTTARWRQCPLPKAVGGRGGPMPLGPCTDAGRFPEPGPPGQQRPFWLTS